MKKRSFTAFVFLGLSVHVFCQQRLSSYVNPFIGASTNVEKGENFAGLGKTFPGAATPFGLVQVSPNTITGGDNGSGYSYEHTSIEGFALTQMSGVGWYGDLGNFLVMPSSGPLKTVAGRLGHEEEGYRSNYDKASEKASAGYYAVKLTKYDVLAELTAAPHSGIMRFTFPAGSQGRIQVDLARRVGGTSDLQHVEVVDKHTIRGWMKCTPDGGGWGHGAGNANYTVFFYAKFNKPLEKFGVWSGDSVQAGVRVKEGKHLGFYTDFATQAGEQVLVKTGISFVSMDGAEKNLKAEIRDWNFDRVHEAARVLWDKALGKVSIEGGTNEEKVIFYTALYHTLIDPRVLSDVDGSYPGGDGKPHKTNAFIKHSIFSGWDVFRSQMPLQTIINPRVVNDLIASLVELADQSGKGYLERWELINAYSGCMVGNPAVVVLADAYVKGIRDYDVAKAYRYAVNTCEQFGNKDGWDPNISVTLENGFSEWCLSQVAAALGKEDDRKKYAARGESFKNIFDDSVHWFRPRRRDGSWEPWPVEGRLKEGYGTVESNPYQQGWFVPHDIPGMVRLMGGREKVIADLQQLFEKTPEKMFWNDYYNHANEPVHHVPFLFNRLGAPWLTQEWSRAICRRAYHNSVEGLVGNEDVGQMSAWYVLAASGLHPVCPGDNRWEITSPVFEKVVMELDPHYAKGKTFTILAHNNSPENIYIQRATLNGRAYNKCWLDHADIMAGGVLELEMGNRPNGQWGVEQALDTVVSRGQEDLVGYANTLQGTNSNFGLSRGNTYPTTALPFAMHAWSAQTGKNGDGWKYQYSAKTIRGFEQVHQCSPWTGDYAVFSLMPVTGKLVVAEDQRASAFSHEHETARPDYYSVAFDNHVRAEMAPVERGSHMRFSFPKGDPAWLVLDGYNKMSAVQILPEQRKIVGWVNNGSFIPKGFRNYFVMEFDQPFVSYGTWENVGNKVSEGKVLDEGKGVGAYVQFRAGAKVQVKIASSYISTEQAQLTLAQELGSFKSFDDTRKAAWKIWNDLFHRVLVEGGTEAQRATFYSCLFRANLFSHQFFEYDKAGKPYYYSPYDGEVHQGYMYTDNGFWDTFRSQFPLNTILHPTMEGRYMQALLSAQRQCGWLPAWSFPSETGGMLGNHAISLLTDAWVKGIRTFDPDSALAAYFHEAGNKGPWGGANGRQGWKEYFEAGFVPYPASQGSTAQTLEYAYDDFCGYQLARMVHNDFYAGVFARQMYNYRNVYDSVTGFMRGRKKDGGWVTPFDPVEWGGPYTEGNAWHWTWSVFHDVQGLINLMGGEVRFTSRIDSVFASPNTVHTGTYGTMIHEMTEMVDAGMGQYAHGNQPIQHMIYLYNYAGQPWKTQQHIREVMDRLYNATENGFPGDEDQGGMSSWYVLSALGLYAVCPGTDQYVIGSPVFPKVTITLENGKKFVIEASGNNARNVYIQSAVLNGTVYTHNWIKYTDIINGGALHFEMGPQPALQRGLAPEDRPFSLSK